MRKYHSLSLLIAIVAATSGRQGAAQSSSQPARTVPAGPKNNLRSDASWMKRARWGVFLNYIHPVSSDIATWNKRTEAFDAEGLAAQLQECGASYVFITVGLNSGYYLAPNKTYDTLTGAAESKCSRRDLIMALSGPLSKRGIKLMAYLPSGAPDRDKVAMERLKWSPGNNRNAEFQRMWEQVIKEWSQRWQGRVAGWWLDGCYYSPKMYLTAEEPNFTTFIQALKSGNRNAVVAFNPGVKVPVTAFVGYDDYTAGEISDTFAPVGRPEGIGDTQYHVLSYLGEYWGRGKPRFSPEKTRELTQEVLSSGGAMTWDVPVTYEGKIVPEFLVQLKALRPLKGIVAQQSGARH